MPSELLPYAVLAGLLLLAVYIYQLASRSREAELKRALRKCEIALQDAERSLDGAARLHANEIRRLNAMRGDARESAATSANNAKLREAKSAFARLFHPDQARGDAREREIRTEMFKQYWRELERIENCG
jgi:hypothetical protein